MNVIYYFAAKAALQWHEQALGNLSVNTDQPEEHHSIRLYHTYITLYSEINEQAAEGQQKVIALQIKIIMVQVPKETVWWR